MTINNKHQCNFINYPRSIVLIICITFASQILAQWIENVELVNYPIRQKIPIGVIEDDLLYGVNRLGLQICDVSDPTDMVEIAFLPLAHNYPLRSDFANSRWIGLHDSYLYIRAETPANVDSFDVYIINVEDPEQPVVVSEWETGYTNKQFWIFGGFLFYANTNSLTRYDLADPVNPREMDSISPWSGTFYVTSDGTYLIGGGAIIDISGDEMIRVADFPIQGNIAIQDTIIAVISQENHHLLLYDFDPPNRVTQLCDTLIGKIIQMNGNFWINGEFIYLSPDYGQLQIVDISNPNQPRITSQLEFRDEDNNLLTPEIFARQGDILFLIDLNSRIDRLHAVNVQNPDRLRRVGEIRFPSVKIDEAFLEDSRLYLNSISDRFRWDLAGPFEAQYRSCFPFRPAIGGQMIGGTYPFGDLVYGTRSSDIVYFQVIDYSTPDSPTPLFELPIPFRFRSYAKMPPNRLINERYLLVTSRGPGLVFDLADPLRPEVVSVLDGLPYDLSVISDDYAIGTESRFLELWSLSDPTHPRLVDRDSTERYSRAVAVNGDLVYTFPHDAENPLTPLVYQIDRDTDQLNLIARGETVRNEQLHFAGGYSATILEGDLLVFTCGSGFLVWDIANPTEPHLVGSHVSYSGECSEAFAAGNDIILNDRFGIGWFRMLTTDEQPHLTTDMDFPLRTTVGVCDTIHLRIANMSDEGLMHITELSINGEGFEIEPYGRWIKQGEMWQRQLLFRPSEIARYDADLLIHLAEGDPVEMHLSGFGTSESAPTVESPIPLTTNLLPCSPNPFNSRTTIKFELNSPEQVRISLFDLQGRQLQTIITGNFKSGCHQTSMSASELATGIYFLRMEAGTRLFQQRVVVIR